MEVKFSFIGETKYVNDLKVQLIDNTELLIETNKVTKLIDMKIDLLNLNLTIKECDDVTVKFTTM